MISRSFYILLVFCVGFTPFSDLSPKAYKKEMKKYRKEIHKKFKNPKESPFRDKADTYKKLEYFPASLTYRVTARFERIKRGKVFDIKTSNPERDKKFVPFAKLHFSIAGKELSLTAYRNLELPRIGKYKKHLFLPFMDLSNGETTYGGGRYLDLEIPEGEEIVLDFNKCYNPYCAYRTDGWSCPIPPQENYLDIEILAGVKSYHKDH
ncbi:MAG: DUF1684 domain-containing protein [Bacteroidota bacterium]